MKFKRLDIESPFKESDVRNNQYNKFREMTSSTLWAVGYDTIRVSIPRRGDTWKSNDKHLKRIFKGTGADVYPLKWIDEGVREINSSLKDIYEEGTGKRFEAVGAVYGKAFAVWMVLLDGAVTIVRQDIHADYLHWEVYGLSQAHRATGALKWELLQRLLRNKWKLEPRESFKLLGYDVSFDCPLPFQEVMDNIIAPYCVFKWIDGTRVERFDWYQTHDNVTGKPLYGTYYLQPKEVRSANNAVKIYDKSHKHKLEYQLTRAEITKKFEIDDRAEISLEYLFELLEQEHEEFL